MFKLNHLVAILTSFLFTQIAAASTLYWNLVNIESESDLTSAYISYNSLNDMLADTNRAAVIFPETNSGFINPSSTPNNLIGSGSDGVTYWNIFNPEGETTFTSVIVTYNSSTDMLNDRNRTDTFFPNTNGAENIVGSGSDGETYWSIFNREEESGLNAVVFTYNSLNDMLTDSNRAGTFFPASNSTNLGNGIDLIGTGSDGETYWTLFNPEGEVDTVSVLVTYETLSDMLSDSNRTGTFSPNAGSAGSAIVATGAMVIQEEEEAELCFPISSSSNGAIATICL